MSKKLAKKQEEIKLQNELNDTFGVNAKLHLGPGEYDSNFS